MMSLAQSTSLNLLAAEPGMKVWMGDEANGIRSGTTINWTATRQWPEEAAPATWLHETELCPYPDSKYA